MFLDSLVEYLVCSFSPVNSLSFYQSSCVILLFVFVLNCP